MVEVYITLGIIGMLSLGAIVTSLGTCFHVRRRLSAEHNDETGVDVEETERVETFQKQGTQAQIEIAKVHASLVPQNKLRSSSSDPSFDLKGARPSIIKVGDFAPPDNGITDAPPSPTPLASRTTRVKKYKVNLKNRDRSDSDIEEQQNGVETATSKAFAGALVKATTALSGGGGSPLSGVTTMVGNVFKGKNKDKEKEHKKTSIQIDTNKDQVAIEHIQMDELDTSRPARPSYDENDNPQRHLNIGVKSSPIRKSSSDYDMSKDIAPLISPVSPRGSKKELGILMQQQKQHAQQQELLKILQAPGGMDLLASLLSKSNAQQDITLTPQVKLNNQEEREKDEQNQDPSQGSLVRSRSSSSKLTKAPVPELPPILDQSPASSLVKYIDDNKDKTPEHIMNIFNNSSNSSSSSASSSSLMGSSVGFDSHES